MKYTVYITQRVLFLLVMFYFIHDVLNLCLRKDQCFQCYLYLMNFTSRNQVKFAVSFNFINKVKMKK